MLDHPPCPACGALEWERVGRKQYAKADIGKLSPYLQRKYSVLFGTWFRGQSVAAISVELCCRCGFVGFSPRPTEEEVTAKYEMSGTLGTHDRHKPVGNADDSLRSEALHRDLASALEGGPRRVLDYGGGDGRLMKAIADAGHACFVVDFIPKPVPGVTRLGTTLADVEPGTTFDVVVLSHVLEHVAEPLKLLGDLWKVTALRGVLWVEVPMELFRQVPPKTEPLTHINFFQPESLRVVMARAGFDVKRCDVRWHITKRQLVVRALGTKGSASDVTPSKGGPLFSRAAMRGDARELFGTVAADTRRTAQVSLGWLKAKTKSMLRRG